MTSLPGGSEGTGFVVSPPRAGQWGRGSRAGGGAWASADRPDFEFGSEDLAGRTSFPRAQAKQTEFPEP